MKTLALRLIPYLHFCLLLIQLLGHFKQEVCTQSVHTKMILSDLSAFPDHTSQLKKIPLKVKKRSIQEFSNRLKKKKHLPRVDLHTYPIKLGDQDLSRFNLLYVANGQDWLDFETQNTSNIIDLAKSRSIIS